MTEHLDVTPAQIADIRLECLQLTFKVVPELHRCPNDLVSAAETFVRFVTDGVSAGVDA